MNKNKQKNKCPKKYPNAIIASIIITIIVLYLLAPLVAGYCQFGDKNGPKIYPREIHSLLYRIGWEINGSYDGKKPREFFLWREKIDLGFMVYMMLIMIVRLWINALKNGKKK
jgi:hypothetical protein